MPAGEGLEATELSELVIGWDAVFSPSLEVERNKIKTKAITRLLKQVVGNLVIMIFLLL